MSSVLDDTTCPLSGSPQALPDLMSVGHRSQESDWRVGHASIVAAPPTIVVTVVRGLRTDG
jgi:hypothetical protein